MMTQEWIPRENDKESKRAIIAITSLRHLNAYGLLTEAERQSIQTKLMNRFGKHMSPLRTMEDTTEKAVDYFYNEKGDYTITHYGEPVAIAKTEADAVKLKNAYSGLSLRIDTLSKMVHLIIASSGLICDSDDNLDRVTAK